MEIYSSHFLSVIVNWHIGRHTFAAVRQSFNSNADDSLVLHSAAPRHVAPKFYHFSNLADGSLEVVETLYYLSLAIHHQIYFYKTFLLSLRVYGGNFLNIFWIFMALSYLGANLIAVGLARRLRKLCRKLSVFSFIIAIALFFLGSGTALPLQLQTEVLEFLY